MSAKRLGNTELRAVVEAWPDDVRDTTLMARSLVLDIAPALDEQIAFGALCYYREGAPYGVIGGNVCLLDGKRGRLEIAFLHGASLPDPEGLLQGEAKAKRYVVIEGLSDLMRPALAALIRALLDAASRSAALAASRSSALRMAWSA